MFLKPVTEIPEHGERISNRRNNNIKAIILEFYNSDMDLAEVSFIHGEYASSASLYSSIKKALITLRDLPVTAEFIQGGIYLRRTD